MLYNTSKSKSLYTSKLLYSLQSNNCKIVGSKSKCDWVMETAILLTISNLTTFHVAITRFTLY